MSEKKFKSASESELAIQVIFHYLVEQEFCPRWVGYNSVVKVESTYAADLAMGNSRARRTVSIKIRGAAYWLTLRWNHLTYNTSILLGNPEVLSLVRAAIVTFFELPLKLTALDTIQALDIRIKKAERQNY